MSKQEKSGGVPSTGGFSPRQRKSGAGQVFRVLPSFPEFRQASPSSCVSGPINFFAKDSLIVHSSTLAKRYASALADLAQDRGMLQKVGENLREFLSVVVATPDFGALLANPTVARETQIKVIDVFLNKAEADTLTANFLKLLIQKRRMVLIDDIVASYGRIEEERSGRVTVHVSVPKPLTKAHEERLIKALATVTGKEVRLDVGQDLDLLGGMIVRIGSVMMDYSVRGQLNRLKAQLRG